MADKYFEPLKLDEFEEKIKYIKVAGVSRHGKWLDVRSDTGTLFAFHLGSTGWFLKYGDTEESECFPHENFLHKVNNKALRLLFTFGLPEGSVNPGFCYGYYDARTWGKFVIPVGGLPWDGYGADWINNTDKAIQTLINHTENGLRTVKSVLCDPKVTAGVGNYLSCESCFRAGIRPNEPWRKIMNVDGLRRKMAMMTAYTVGIAMASSTHKWWAVFKKADELCRTCAEKIQYEKDPGGSRGSYFCPNCQPVLNIS